MGHRTFTEEQTMSNVNTESKTFTCELTEEDLDRVSGGGARIEPSESVSFNFAKVEWSYIPSDPC
jgi:hypothetical protein